MEKSPIFLEQEKAQELCDICGEILRNARNELYMNLRFMDTALSATDIPATAVPTDTAINMSSLRTNPRTIPEAAGNNTCSAQKGCQK